MKKEERDEDPQFMKPKNESYGKLENTTSA